MTKKLLLSISSLFLGMSDTLARHYAHLFIRDPLVIMKEYLHSTDDNTAYHFEV